MTFKSSGLRLALVVFAGAGLQLGCGGSDKTEVVPQPPKLEAINPVTVKEGTPLTIAVKATDVDSPADSLTFLLENAPTGMTMAGSTLSWTPGYDQAGSHTVGVTVKDDTGLTAKIDIAITVENVNRAPTIDLPPTLNGKAGEALTIAVTASDPDGDTVTITWDTMPPGAFWDSATNTVSWTPGFNQVGSHQIVFTATDNGNPALMTSLRVVISVQATNRAPVLEPIGGKEVDATSLLTFVVRANDPDLDAVTLAATGLPTGASFDPATGVFNWRPTLADVGTVTVNFTATDAGGLVDSEAVTIVVNTKNLAPVLADPGPKTVAEGAALAFTLAATDPNTADTLIYSYSPALPGAVLNPTTGAFSWTPGFSAAGSYSVTFTATDNGTPPLSASRTVTLTVTDANRAPTVSFIGNQTVAQGETLSFIVSATDPDGDTLTLSSSTLPTNATFSTSSGAFSFSPSFSQTGTETITFTATDPGGLTGSQTVQIAINSTNRKPVLANVAAQTVAEGAQLNITLSATDPDGDTLTYSFSGSLPTGATFDPATRRFSWTPGYSQAGTYSVTFVATDNGVPALSDSKSANITVTNTNRAPEFVAVGPQTVKITENLTFTLNVSDPDGDSVTVAAGTLPTNATFDAASRRFSFNPVLGQEGSYTVNFTATDSGSLTATLAVSITVVTKNLAPTLAAIGTQTVAEGAQLTFTVSATDPNTGDVMTYSASPIPSGATFDPATGTFTWTPNYTQAGSYTVTFTATDNGVPALSDSKQGVITVTNVNNAPILAFIGNKAVAEGANLTFVVSANDPNGDTVTLAAAPLPNNASFSPSTGTFTFNPAFGQAGTYSVTFTATDNGSPQMSDNETISIVVGAVNRAPTLANPGFQTIGEAATLAFNLSASDPDGNGLTYSATGLPTGATLNAATGAFSWTPTYLQAGSYQVTFIVTDDGAPNLSAQQSTTITVNNTNRAPVISPIANISSPEGTAISFTVSASDPDLDGVTLSASSLPAGATFNPSTGVFSWTPTYSQSGTYSPTFTATDDYNPTASSNATPTLTINNVPLTVVTAVSPNRGPSTGNTTVVVTAPGVNTGATVTVNALSATVQSVDEAAGTVTIRTPASLGTAALVDVVVTNPDTSTATGSNIFRYFYGQVTMTGSTYGAPWGVGGVALADMDLDLDLDVVISEHRCGTRVQVRYNDGSGDFPTASADFDPGFGGCNTNKVTTGDLDGDGRPDIILPQRWGNNVRVIRNPSTGLVMLSAVNVGIQNKGEPVVGDFDEDGRLDVFFLAGNGSVAFAKGAGDGTFSTITQWATGLNRVGHARAVDIDGDGNLDLVGKGYWDRVTSVLYGDGAGNFTTYNYTANIGGCRDALEVADNDLDGDIDIYGLTGCGNPGYVWRNNGDRNFTQVDVSSVNNDSREARRFDVDRDGTPDTFVSARCNSNTLTLSRGQGWPGTISASTAYLGYCTRTAAIGDINGDGKEDIVGGAGGGGVLQRWIVTSQ